MNNVSLRQHIDTGIGLDKDVLEYVREDETFKTNNYGVKFFSNLAYFLTAPISIFCAFKQVNPMQDVIVSRGGVVTDVLRTPGWHHINPCCTSTFEVNMGLNDIEISRMKANDSHANPIIVSAQMVYRVSDSVTSIFMTKTLNKYLKDQGETTLRDILSRYPFDNGEEKGECLRKHSERIESELTEHLDRRAQSVGIKIESFRLINVSIEASMEKLLLARQEAQAEVNARKAIAEGTTGILQETLTRLNALGIELQESERNRFATNLTLMLVNHGNTTLNLFQESGPSPLAMTYNRKDKEKEK